MGAKPKKQRSDLEKGQPKTKAKERNEEYIRYRNYLRSKKFGEVKKLVNERCEGRCVFCRRSREDGVTLATHHTTYKHLYEGGETEANDCILICTREHKLLHSMKCNYKWFSKDNPRNRKDGQEA